MNALKEKAKAIIEEDFAMLAGVGELADALGVTKCHLIRAFKAETGLTPGECLEEARLRHAKILLSLSDHSVEAVAQMVGYSGANYFCKVFRRAEGKTPLAFRKLGRRDGLSPAEKNWLEETDRLSYT